MGQWHWRSLVRLCLESPWCVPALETFPALPLPARSVLGQRLPVIPDWWDDVSGENWTSSPDCLTPAWGPVPGLQSLVEGTKQRGWPFPGGGDSPALHSGQARLRSLTPLPVPEYPRGKQTTEASSHPTPTPSAQNPRGKIRLHHLESTWLGSTPAFLPQDLSQSTAAAHR